MIFEGFIDVLFSGDQDIEFEKGDIKITRGIDALKREIFKRLITEKGDWPLFPNEGSSLSNFVGEPNTRDAASAIKKFLMEQLSSVIAPVTMQVSVIPVALEEVDVLITLYMFDQLIGTVSLQVDYINGITYAGFDDQVDKIVSSSKTRINETGSTRQYNKYWDQIRKQ